MVVAEPLSVDPVTVRGAGAHADAVPRRHQLHQRGGDEEGADARLSFAIEQGLAIAPQQGVQGEVGGHGCAAGVVPAARNAVAVAFFLRVAGRRAAAAQADARRADDGARHAERQKAREPARARAQGQHPAHAAVDGGHGFFQTHHLRQGQLCAARAARRQHRQPAAPVQQGLLHRMQKAGRIGRLGVARDTARVAFGKGSYGSVRHGQSPAMAKAGIFAQHGGAVAVSSAAW
ncbi:hypothetical protein D3C85_443380 [compost metagenome]